MRNVQTDWIEIPRFRFLPESSIAGRNFPDLVQARAVVIAGDLLQEELVCRSYCRIVHFLPPFYHNVSNVPTESLLFECSCQ